MVLVVGMDGSWFTCIDGEELTVSFLRRGEFSFTMFTLFVGSLAVSFVFLIGFVIVGMYRLWIVSNALSLGVTNFQVRGCSVVLGLYLNFQTFQEQINLFLMIKYLY